MSQIYTLTMTIQMDACDFPIGGEVWNTAAKEIAGAALEILVNHSPNEFIDSIDIKVEGAGQHHLPAPTPEDIEHDRLMDEQYDRSDMIAESPGYEGVPCVTDGFEAGSPGYSEASGVWD